MKPAGLCTVCQLTEMMGSFFVVLSMIWLSRLWLKQHREKAHLGILYIKSLRDSSGYPALQEGRSAQTVISEFVASPNFKSDSVSG